MSKEQEHIDKLIKAKLADRNFGTPPKTFIDDLNIRLDKANKKPFGFYLFTLLASLLFGAFLILLLTPSEFKMKVERNLTSRIENKNEKLAKELNIDFTKVELQKLFISLTN